MRITTILGAGAAVDIGGPSSFNITDKVKASQQVFFNKSRPFIREVAEVLETYYKSTKVNFEDIFHALEQLTTYRWVWEKHMRKEYKPSFGAFVQPITSNYFDSEMLGVALRDLVDIVAESIHSYDKDYLLQLKNKWHTQFWQKLLARSSLDIATLNYDTCMEQIINHYNDGFEPTGHSFKIFNPMKLFSDSRESKIMHLHGCIKYGYSRTKDINEYAFIANHEELFCYNNFEDAKKTWHGRSTNTNQAGESAIMGPLLTGLHKSDKIQALPYSYYNAELINAVTRNSSLLIVGYSFSDKHINRVLETMTRVHGNKRRIVFIAYANKKEWHPNVYESAVMNTEMFFNVSMAFQEDTPISNLKYEPFITSKDGCARIYFSGFKNTVKYYGNSIIDFLIS